eukprot:gnl/Trimastix_PCT/4407.p1 GENE.gnl/Trimastix_PCT/4407~~gnl/Trimastix_PCT/4407.p1  ORF type:complete len:346 (+),score=86.04 gnl/Trimastix_PCT/4407:424-1461(+)
MSKHALAQQYEREGGNIVVATAGRMKQFLDEEVLNVRKLEVLVLDEADRLLDLNSATDINLILGRLPKQRRTGIFSATQTKALDDLARAGLRNQVIVRIPLGSSLTHSIDPSTGHQVVCDASDYHYGGMSERVKESIVGKSAGQKTPSELQNFYLIVPAEEKLARLLTFIQAHREAKCIVYFLTCNCVQHFARMIEELSLLPHRPLFLLHGRMGQNKRTAMLNAFLRSRPQEHGPGGAVLFCTDVAARGIDFPDVDWIIQFDPPQAPDVFVHRVGRTARMGRTGNALLFLLPQEDLYVEFLGVRETPIVPWTGPASEPYPPPLPTHTHPPTHTHTHTHNNTHRPL